MARQATKACGNRYFEARMRAAKWNEKLSTRAGAIDYLPGVTEDSLKKYELDITRPPNIVVALMADAYNEPELRHHRPPSLFAGVRGGQRVRPLSETAGGGGGMCVSS